MATELKAGDIVRLKSGGPDMTVDSAGTNQIGNDFAVCVWHDGGQRRDTFNPAALEPVDLESRRQRPRRRNTSAMTA